MKKQSFWEVSDVVVMKRKLGGGGGITEKGRRRISKLAIRKYEVTTGRRKRD